MERFLPFFALFAIALFGQVSTQTTGPVSVTGCSYRLVPEQESCPSPSTGNQRQLEVQMVRLERQLKTLQGLVLDLEGNNGCSKLLVSGETPIPDSAITASSYHSSGYLPAASRIYTTTDSGCWAARVNNHQQWLKFDLGQPKRITGIITKGRHSYPPQFVRRYKFYYSSVSPTQFTVYKDQTGRDKLFHGNFDAETVRKNVLEPAVTARYVWIAPVTWYGHISMRVDFLGCNA